MSVVYADLSRWNGDIDWAHFTLPGALLKVGGSDDGIYQDAKYVANAGAARSYKKHLGHYWFNGSGTAKADAAFFLANLAHYEDEDLLVLDIETPSKGAAWSPVKALDFFKTVKAAKPKARLVAYMNQSVENSANWKPVVDFGVQLWLAHYGVNDGTVAGSGTYTLTYWPKPLLVQFTSVGTAAGVPGHVDLSIASVDLFPVAAPPPVKDIVVSTAGSYIYSPKPSFTLSNTKWLEVPIDDHGGLSFVYNFDGVVLANVAFAFGNLPAGSTVQARLEILTVTAGAISAVAFSDVAELQGSGGTAFPTFSDSVALRADQRLRLVVVAQTTGVTLLRSSVSVIRFPKG